MSKASRLLGWFSLAALVLVTVSPIGYRPVSHVPVSVERLGAFALLGFLFAVGYPRQRLYVLVLTAGAAGVLEALQMLEPTRHGRVADVLVKLGGVGLGNLAGLIVSHVSALPPLRRV